MAKREAVAKSATGRTSRPSQASTPERIKAAAQRLVAEHGVDGVSVRDIVTAAGQKNMASLHYYFGTKERLLQELVVDAAIYMENRRSVALAELLASGREPEVRDLVYILALGAAVQEDKEERHRTVMRFLTALYPNYREIFESAIGTKYNRTYQRCLSLIRDLVSDIPVDILNTRLLFLSLTMMHLFSAREAALEARPSARAYWAGPRIIANMVDAYTGMLLAPVQPAALAVAEATLSPEAATSGRRSGSGKKSAMRL